MAPSPTITANWHEALEAARHGSLDAAEKARTVDAQGPLARYFYGRCLAEAGERLDEALDHLRAALKADPCNRIFEQALAMALLRTRQPDTRAEAGRIWKRLGLPHDRDLLAAVALTIEDDLRPVGEALVDFADLAWPSCLPRDAEAEEALAEAAGVSDANGEGRDRVKMSPKPASKPTGLLGRWLFSRAVGRLEKALIDHKCEPVLREATAILETGRQTAELHLLAGIAAEECGELDRARAHLARCVLLEPELLIARAYQGRVYWRLGWNDLAESVWRSLPVEGPYDNGRHYFLALAHEARGDRGDALKAMDVALGEFFYDSLHFYVERSLWLWQWRFASGQAELA